MDRVHPLGRHQLQQLVLIQVGVARPARTEREAGVDGLDVQRVGVAFGEHAEAADPQLAQRPGDAHGDFAAVGDEDRPEHSQVQIATSIGVGS